MALIALSNAVILEGEELSPTVGQLRIRDGMIEKIVRGSVRRGDDMRMNLIMPPFVNAHTHVMDSVAKEGYLGKRLDEVVGENGEKFKALALSPDAQVRRAAAKTLEDMIRTGTLAHCDFREDGVRGVKMLREISTGRPVSIILGRPTHKNETEAVLRAADGIGLPSVDGYTTSELRGIADEVHRRGKTLALHIAEDRPYADDEMGKVLRMHPKFLVHGTHLSENQLALLAKKGIPLVFCPRSNHLLGAGEPPLKLALEGGVKFLLGTDNAMVCQPEMFGEISFAWAHLRLADDSCGAAEACALLRSATVDAARFFELPWGPIEEGNPATFIVLARKNNLMDIKNIHAGLVNRARAENVIAVYASGRKIAPA
jgi:cytosine/adenosine deaminase-related metal-dependent hydrolase